MITAQHHTHSYRWNFSRFGGVTQVLLNDAEDIAHLSELDLKLWTVLSMPTQGIFFDPQTIALIDIDADGFIRPPEILAAADWLATKCSNLSILMEHGDAVPLAFIKDDTLKESARWLLGRIGKPDAQEISIADIEQQKQFFASHAPACGTALSADCSDEQRLQHIISAQAVFHCKKGTAPDSAQQHIMEDLARDVQNMVAWYASLEEVSPLDAAHTQKAWIAFSRIKEKAEDYFLRCALTVYAPDKSALVQADEKILQDLARKTIGSGSEALAALPLASVYAGNSLPLSHGVNPAWKQALQDFKDAAVIPILGIRDTAEAITQAEFMCIAEHLAPYGALLQSKPDSPAALFSRPFLHALTNGEKQAAIAVAIRDALTLEKERNNAANLEKLVLLRRDFVTLLKNYISFSNFYEGKGSIFQAGVLYFDTRAADLCFILTPDARHTALDTLSGAYLVYCDISRKGEADKKMVAMFTDGDCDYIVAGRNGIFYDRAGNDWNAVVTKVIANPISVRQAFFMPYKQLAAMIEKHIADRAAAGEAKSADLLAQTASAITSVDKKKPEAAAQGVKPSASNNKLDLGTIALIGTALGGISALIGSILQALFGLGFWVPLGIIGILLCISGPSMILASMKLRKRSIAPILEANGWAINIRTKVNIPFGAQRTQLAAIPFGSMVVPVDPFRTKKRGRTVLLALLGFLIAGSIAFYVIKFGVPSCFNVPILKK